MTDEVVYLDGDLAIVKSTRPFGVGWNVYKADAPGSDNFTKINDPSNFFSSFEAARKWLDKHKAEEL